MMVNCPKCGFSQPRDQYCAKCGVDMLAYRPAQKPLHIRLLGHSITHLALLVTLIVGVFGYVRHQNQAELADRISDLDSSRSTRLIERSGETKSISQASSSASVSMDANPGREAAVKKVNVAVETETSKEKENVPPHGPPTSPTRSETTTPTTTTNGPPNEIPTNASETKPDPAAANSGHALVGSNEASATGSGPRPATSVRVHFAEVHRIFLNTIVDQRSVTSFGNSYSMGFVSSLEAKLKSARQDTWVSLESAAPQSQPLIVNQPVVVYRGTRDGATGQNLGLTVEITPTSPTADDSQGQGLPLQLRVTRVLRDPSLTPPIDETTIPNPELFQVPSGSSLFLAGVLPRRPLTENDEQLYRTVNVLKVLTSESFKANITEFVIFIEPR